MESSNYLAWASSVKMWCKDQGVQHHLTNNACIVDEKTKSSDDGAKVEEQWEKVDAKLHSPLWRSIGSKVDALVSPIQDMLFSLGKDTRFPQ